MIGVLVVDFTYTLPCDQCSSAATAITRTGSSARGRDARCARTRLNHLPPRPSATVWLTLTAPRARITFVRRNQPQNAHKLYKHTHTHKPHHHRVCVRALALARLIYVNLQRNVHACSLHITLVACEQQLQMCVRRRRRRRRVHTNCSD